MCIRDSYYTDNILNKSIKSVHIVASHPLTGFFQVSGVRTWTPVESDLYESSLLSLWMYAFKTHTHTHTHIYFARCIFSCSSQTNSKQFSVTGHYKIIVSITWNKPSCYKLNELKMSSVILKKKNCGFHMILNKTSTSKP